MSLMTSFKTPCGSKSYYPEIIDYYTRLGKVCVFHTLSEKSRKAYLVMPKKRGVEFIANGTMQEIGLFYESIDLVEHKVSDPNGVFFFKQAENENELDVQIKRFITDQM